MTTAQFSQNLSPKLHPMLIALTSMLEPTQCPKLNIYRTQIPRSREKLAFTEVFMNVCECVYNTVQGAGVHFLHESCGGSGDSGRRDWQTQIKKSMTATVAIPPQVTVSFRINRKACCMRRKFFCGFKKLVVVVVVVAN